MGRYRPYERYVATTNRWLEELPLNWMCVPVWAVADVIDPQPDHRAPALVEGSDGYPYVGIRDVNKDGSLNFETARQVSLSAVEKQEQSFSIDDGDIIFCKVGTLGLPRKIQPHGRCALSATLVLIKVKPSVESQYLLYALDGDATYSQLSYLARGSTRQALGIQQIRKMSLPCPSFDEQRLIAAFLDHETAKIDRLIARQERLIELLKEKRQAVISHAVTKGLNPDAPMKDSGVEWLGEVPAHWAVSRVGFVSRLIQTGPFGSQLHAEDYVEGGVPVINPANIQAGEIVPDDRVSVDAETAERLQRHQLEENEIIFARRGELGRCALVTSDTKGWICGTGSLKISLDAGKVEPAFVTRFLRITGVKEELSLSSKGSTMENLNAEILSKVSLVYPDIKEQQSILQYLSETEEKLERLYQRAGDAVTLLKEHRKALISAAVTGKIDVRNFKPANA